MPKFEVHIPPPEPGGFNITLRVEAENWMAALKLGLRKLGEQGSTAQNVLVDIQDDNSMHVTDPQSGRVFRIRELSEQEAEKSQVKAETRPPPPQPITQKLEPVRRRAQEEPTDPHGAPLSEEVGATTEPMLSSLPLEAPPEPARAEVAPEPKTLPPGLVSSLPASVLNRPVKKQASWIVDPGKVVELERTSRPAQGQIGRPRPAKDRKAEIEDLLAEVFERVQEVYARGDEESALYYVLDLALEKIAAESGTVFRSDDASGDLRFAAVRGPKAEELLRSKLVVPYGNGIVGFCATEGVSVAVSDVQKDPRFYAAVSEKVSYETRSLLCAPMMTHGRSFGCMQLVNRQGAPMFTEQEMGILSYLAHQAALYLSSR